MSLTPLKLKNSHTASDVQTDSDSQKPSSALSCLRLGIGGPVGSGKTALTLSYAKTYAIRSIWQW
ncbi:hypothetical protein JCM18901_1785 [Psychrobacter sp. JCM 18901]|nr:hypothetical protein JCM18901_1785 [Psychrobacter sp. JCM 18901]